MSIRTGVLIHGRHLQAQEWERLVWGEPPDLLGSVPRGILVAMEEDAKIVVFGTGASEKDGKKEAVYTMDFMWDNFSRLAEFTAFRGRDLTFLKKRMMEISVCETRSQNTAEEVKFAGEFFIVRDVEKVVLVSSPTHLARCFQTAYAVFETDEKLASLSRNLFATPSDTCYAGSKVSDVLILEPPHRGDDPLLKLPKALQPHRLIRRLFGLNTPQSKTSFLEDLDELFNRHGV